MVRIELVGPRGDLVPFGSSRDVSFHPKALALEIAGVRPHPMIDLVLQMSDTRFVESLTTRIRVRRSAD